MTIRDENLYLKSQVDWAILDGCFPGRIAPTDVDGLVEIGGRFLLLEHKLPDAGISHGQIRTFRAFSALPGWAVIAFHSEAPHDQIDAIRMWQAGVCTKYEDSPHQLSFLRGLVTEWATTAKAAAA